MFQKVLKVLQPRRGLADAKRLKNLKSPHAGGFRFGGLGACHQQADIRARARISLLANDSGLVKKPLITADYLPCELLCL